jgi:predicted dehydrogenase
MKQFNVGVVGYGWVASAHIPAINACELAQVAAVCSARPLDPAELSRKHGGKIRVYSKLKDLLADPEIHVVSLCSFPPLHPGQAIAAAEAGKHLIIEKPVALNLKDLRRVQKAVKRAGVKTCVGFECRYSSQFLATKPWWTAVCSARPLRGGGLLSRHRPWYAQYRWSKRQDMAGSSLLSAGCHAMDALLLFMNSPVVEVMSYACRSANPSYADYQFPGTVSTLVKFRSAAVGKCTSSVDCLQPYYFHTHLVGSKGSLLDNRFHSPPGNRRDAWTPSP